MIDCRINLLHLLQALLNHSVPDTKSIIPEGGVVQLVLMKSGYLMHRLMINSNDRNQEVFSIVYELVTIGLFNRRI